MIFYVIDDEPPALRMSHQVIQEAFPNSQVFIFYKNYSAQVLKANMRAVGNFETAVLFYRDKLPKYWFHKVYVT